ncbi:MAG: hypothetical protein GYB41_10615 [Oceanospirillales bacterium]|uniref:DUF4388 domain-containing protein n=1 Tax=Marinobacterium halophilum TaxID=267374 RepID=A0A2P8EQT9_9GAMM|nr:hypothetical protein [Marinobacterium halophilum]MBR9829081.1 hypothetical protein [Oceanospirillales bacterium]PSL11839.1 hypothetical protein CLV44_12262 [Marinobacterium halophilum]
MSHITANFNGLKNTLFALVDKGASGTLFVATEDNHAAQIVLFKGRLQGAACNGCCNVAAFDRLATMAELRFAFTPELIYPVADTLLPEQGDQLLQQLGYVLPVKMLEDDAGCDLLGPAAQPQQTLRVYRGRVITG